NEIEQVLLGTYQPLSLLDPSNCLSVNVHEANQQAGVNALEVYPNPFTESTSVKFTVSDGQVLLQVFDAQGKQITTLMNRRMAAGTYTVPCDLGPVPVGIYYCRLQNGSTQQVKNMLKVQ
ncbi:MAG: T9SS type A sorting domain-containing protein, partial [Flavobacteriales bacterium]